LKGSEEMNREKLLFKAIYKGLVISNSCIGAIYLASQITKDFNFIIAIVYFIISVIFIYLVAFEN
jgi:uncharacterized membrane protein